MDVAGSSQRQLYDYPSPELQWSQITPQYMPWGHSPNAPAAPLVKFTAQYSRPQLAPGSFAKPQRVDTHIKRKADFDTMNPVKQHITEEKMAAHMSRLHISSETESPMVAADDQASHEKRLFVCEEMRRLQTESILPSSLLGRLERPCMAVMLWQPPPKIPDVPAAEGRPAEEETDNNNSLTVDLNSMDFDG